MQVLVTRVNVGGTCRIMPDGYNTITRTSVFEEVKMLERPHEMQLVSAVSGLGSRHLV